MNARVESKLQIQVPTMWEMNPILCSKHKLCTHFFSSTAYHDSKAFKDLREIGVYPPMSIER